MRLPRHLPVAIAGLLMLAMPIALMRPAVSSDPILTVSASPPAAVTVDLDLAALERMPHQLVATARPWAVE
jgi:hypothetical protein